MEGEVKIELKRFTLTDLRKFTTEEEIQKVAKEIEKDIENNIRMAILAGRKIAKRTNII